MCLPDYAVLVNPPDLVRRRLEDWKRRLVDPTRRNRLLYFRPASGGTMQVEEPRADELFVTLYANEREWQVWEPTSADEDSTVEQMPLGNVPPEAPPQRDRRRRPNEVRLEAQGRQKWSTCLAKLRLRARTAYEETGLHILHLAVGILAWQEQETSEEVLSPIILLPVELKRESRRSPYVLSPADEEPVLNPALAIRLDRDFRVTLPPLPDDWETVPPSVYLDQLAHRACAPGWAVRHDVYLGLFSFQKLVIYKDLGANESTICAHPVVRAMGGESDSAAVGGDLPDPSSLDHLVTPKESFLVVDADSSQLAALQAVKLGRSLVIQGPPGTGKSQTITNVLAEMIAAGKSVLFVSEKMAALEVVRNRLKAAHLDSYCLELHSHKARRREVVNELWRAFVERPEPRSAMSEEEFERLVRRRTLLNDYVQVMHERRGPLGRSAYEVLGELVFLNDAPTLTWVLPESCELRPDLLAELADLSSRLARVWPVVVEEGFPWRGCIDTEFTPRTADQWFQALTEARTATDALRQASSTLALACECRVPGTLEDVEWLLGTANLIEETLPLLSHWFSEGSLARLTEEASQWSEFTDDYRRRANALSQRFRIEFFRLPTKLAESMRTAAARLQALLGVELTRVLESRKPLEAWIRATLAAIPRIEREARQLRSALGLPERTLSLDETSRLVRIATLVNGPDRPPGAWLDLQTWDTIQRGIDDLESLYRMFNEVSRGVFAHYDESVLSLDVDVLIVRFSGPYQSVLRWLRPSYYRDRARLRACRHDHQVPADPLHDLQQVRTLLRLRAELRLRRAKWIDLLGAYDQGPDTDFGRARRALAIAQHLVGLLVDDAEVTAIGVRLSRPVSNEIATLVSGLEATLADLQRLLDAAAAALPETPLPGFTAPVNALAVDQLSTWLADTQHALCAVVEPLDMVTGLAIDATPGGLGLNEALEAFEKLDALRAMEETFLEATPRLEAVYGHYFRGMDTSWPELFAAVEWAERIRTHFGSRTMPPALLDLLGNPPRSLPGREACQAGFERAAACLAGIRGHFASPALADRPGFLRTAEEIARERHRGVPSEIGPLSVKLSVTSSWEQLDEQILSLIARIDDLPDWIDYRLIREALAAKDLASLCDSLEAARVPPERVAPAMRRALLQGWYEGLLKRVPVLARFRGEDHEALISEFRDLDRRHWQVGNHRVIAAANAHRPAHHHIEPDGEVAILRKEYNKARRHLPVRQLIWRIPTLLPRLKPVVMMSPISVSHFLPSHMTFDLVVFDEASQIFPEDSIGSIYRSRQAVVCGDSKQLPPTDFFTANVFDDMDDEETAAEATDVFQSVLEELAASGLPQCMLRWHYRSRHESLIAFSNAQFYDYRLITFPAPLKISGGLGIRFEYVPDGIYDRGRTRTNRSEAKRVAELVLEHFRRWPDTNGPFKKTLGVIAFSESQRDAIMQALEQLADPHRELEQRLFEDDRLDGFFVKNLENVQGDERDVMIFSVGYGRDATGQMEMTFGPINRPGGERRLNVAITRAREQVILVSSIRASDIDITRTRSAGALLLRAYLDYAERGEVALELPPKISLGDPESPLEEDVTAAIRAMGYQTVYQVGCSRFRIDIGVVDPEQPGRFLLGVECDGATYHSGATARDRDRLRQEVLERLGWSIHRVWSPDWLMRRPREIERLRRAIEAARARQGAPQPDVPAQAETPIVRVLPVVAEEHNEGLPPEVESYEVARLGTIRLPAPKKFHDTRNQTTIVRLIEETVGQEGPIHRELLTRRILDACDVQRLGGNIKAAMRRALNSARQARRIRQDGDFFYPSGLDCANCVRAPREGQDETARKIDQIPLDELQLAMEIVLKWAGSVDAEGLQRRVARIFGFRVSDNIRERLEKALDRGMREGQFRVDSGTVTRGKRP